MKNKPSTIYELDTPCLLLDYNIMLNNMKQMHEFIIKNKKEIRPHVKSHKCSYLAGLQVEHGAKGLCTANLSEALKLFQNGFDNILITRPIVEMNKLLEVIELVNLGKDVTVVVDNEDIIDTYDKIINQTGSRLKVLLDINAGFGRTGFSPNRVLEIADKIKNKKHICIKGIQAYAGHMQHIKNFNDRKNRYLECMKPVVDIFNELKRREFECDIFSGGGTGTHNIDVGIKELTELQVGSYMLMDAQYLDVEFNDERTSHFLSSSLSVLSTVISTNQENYITIDAGLKSIYRDDPSPIVLTGEKGNSTYEWFGDEYGKINFSQKEKIHQLGSKIRLVPSHCDPTVNLFDTIYITSGETVIDRFPIDLRGCSQ